MNIDKILSCHEKKEKIEKDAPFLNSFTMGRQGLFALWLILNGLTGFIQYNHPSLGYTMSRGYSKLVYSCGFMTFFWMTCFAGVCTLFSKTKTKRAISQSVFLLNFAVMGVYALHYSGLTITLKDLGGYPLDAARYVEWLVNMHQLAAIIGFITRSKESKVNRSILYVWALTLAGFVGSLLDGPLSEAFLIFSYCTHCVAVTDLWDMYSHALQSTNSTNSTNAECNLNKEMLSMNQFITNYSWHAFALVHFLSRFHFIPFAFGEALYFVSHVFAKIPLTLMVLTAPDEEYTPLAFEETNKVKVF